MSFKEFLKTTLNKPLPEDEVSISDSEAEFRDIFLQKPSRILPPAGITMKLI